MKTDNPPKGTFIKRHPIVMNALYIIAAGLVLCWLSLLFLDYWTDHGQERAVPGVKGMSIVEATNRLRAEGFPVEISDSIYESNEKPGSVIEQAPRQGARVKERRTVYLTIVAFSPKMVTVPDISNVSTRQAQSIFEGLGIKNIKIVEIESEYEGLLLAARFNGLPLSAGARIPVTAAITLEVGKGYSFSELDSLALDSPAHPAINIEELNLE